MKLKEWLDQENMSGFELSKKIRYQPSYLYRIIKEKQAPGLRLSIDIETFTGGAVTRQEMGYIERKLCPCPTCGAFPSRKKKET